MPGLYGARFGSLGAMLRRGDADVKARNGRRAAARHIDKARGSFQYTASGLGATHGTTRSYFDGLSTNGQYGAPRFCSPVAQVCNPPPVAQSRYVSPVTQVCNPPPVALFRNLSQVAQVCNLRRRRGGAPATSAPPMPPQAAFRAPYANRTHAWRGSDVSQPGMARGMVLLGYRVDKAAADRRRNGARSSEPISRTA